MLAKLLVIAGLVSAGLLFVILTMTTPASGGALAILAVFLLSYCIILSVMTFIIWFTSKIMIRLHKSMNKQARDTSLGLRKSYYYSSVISLAPVIVASLQSVGRVGIYELGLIVLFIALGCVYVTKRVA